MKDTLWKRLGYFNHILVTSVNLFLWHVKAPKLFIASCTEELCLKWTLTFVYISGEFGSVYKARLKQQRSTETVVVAVKTMKGSVAFCSTIPRTSCSCSTVEVESVNVLPYIRKLLREKTFANNWWKYDFRGENLCGLLTFAVPKDTTPRICGETFAYSHKTAKFAQVFSLKSFPLYGMVWMYYGDGHHI